MSHRLRSVLVSACTALALVGGISLVAPPPRPLGGQPEPSSLATQQPGTLPDPSIVGKGSGSMKGLWTETRHETLEWSVLGRRITVTRRERETPTSAWHGQEQVVSVSFLPVDVATHCTCATFVAGFVPETGKWVLERWEFLPPPTHDPQGLYIPLHERRLPGVRMTPLWQGDERGELRAIESDPENRFLLVLTASPSLWKLSFSTGGWSVLHDAASFPALGSLRSLKVLQHVTEGRKYLLTPTSQNADVTPVGASGTVQLLNDPDNDGQLDAPVAVDKETWNASGYAQRDAWTRVCP